MTFFDRVDSQVVATWIQNTFSTQSFSKIFLKKEQFTFVNGTSGLETYDGVIMLFLVLTLLDPSVVVGIKIIRKKLETMKLAPFKNNVDEMCTQIKELMYKIEGAGEKCESIRRYTLTAFMTGPNAKFNQFIDCIQDDIKSEQESTTK